MNYIRKIELEDGCAIGALACFAQDGELLLSVSLKICKTTIDLGNPGEGNGQNSNNDPKEKLKLLDLEYSFVLNSTPIDIVELNKLKNKSLVISEDMVLENGDVHAIIKAGTYKVTNGKMRTLISKQIE